MKGRLGNRWRCIALLVGLLILACAGGVVSVASAETTVTVDCARGGDLQGAINNGDNTTIVIRGRCVGQFVITGRQALTLEGDAGAVLDGQGAGPALFIDACYVCSTGPVTLQRLKITNGRPGIAFFSTSAANSLTVRGVLVSGNEQSSSGLGEGGAGIELLHAGLKLFSSSVSGNGATSGGGGIGGSDAGIVAQNSLISRNVGGGINGFLTPINLVQTLVIGNTGGGINASNTTYGPVQLTDSVVSGNTASYGGGISVGSFTNVTLTRTIVSQNVATGDGGGIYYAGFGFGFINLTLVDSAIVSNTAAGRGGGIFSTGVASTLIQHSTVAANRSSYGGGIYNDGTSAALTLQPGTSIIRNIATVTGGGIYNNQGVVSITPPVLIALNRPNNCTGFTC